MLNARINGTKVINPLLLRLNGKKERMKNFSESYLKKVRNNGRKLQIV